MLGDTGGGKSTLLHRLQTEDKLPRPHATKGVDYKSIEIQVDTNVVKLQVNSFLCFSLLGAHICASTLLLGLGLCRR